MEFQDVLHGKITISNPFYHKLISDLLSCTEIQRLRNMRQMNFDVPLIQELGRSRRLPHSIGVTHIAITLAQNSGLSEEKTKELIAASMLHDAAIPPYGHLVESQLNQKIENGFKHAQVIKDIINGSNNEDKNRFSGILHGRIPEVRDILIKHEINPSKVYELISPDADQYSSIAADIDIDNLDNVHRMAIMLGWEGARENLRALLQHSKISKKGRLIIDKICVDNINIWLDFRQKIYTLIIAHPECIPQNALQSDLVKLSVDKEIISKDNWFITEPEFEEKLRSAPETSELAWQLISGCTYHLIDYIWAKDLLPKEKMSNNSILNTLEKELEGLSIDYSLFIWYEKRLISRELQWYDSNEKVRSIGVNSHSCLIALVKKTSGGGLKKRDVEKWRKNTWRQFSGLVGNDNFTIEYPSDYIGDYFSKEKESGSLF